MKTGARIVIIGGNWPERIGCEGHAQWASDPMEYPFWCKSPSEVVVVLDDDPIDSGFIGGWFVTHVRYVKAVERDPAPRVFAPDPARGVELDRQLRAAIPHFTTSDDPPDDDPVFGP